MKQNLSSPRSLWNALTEPHAEIRRRRDRHRAKFLAGSVLTLAIVGFPLALYVTVALNVVGGAAGLVNVGLLLLCYALSRSQYAKGGGVLLVIGQTLFGFWILLATQFASIAASTIAFMLIPILFSMLLLPARWTAGLAIGINSAIGIYAGVSGSMAQFYAPMTFLLIISTISAITSFLRERDFDTIEQQAEQLTHRASALTSETDERTRAIMMTAEIAQIMTGSREVNAMLKQVASLIVERFQVYHAQIFLIEPGARQARLYAASGAASDELMARNDALPLSVQSVVTRVISRGEAVAVNDTDVDPIHRRNELLPLTRSEIGLPLRVSGQVIGALNIHSVIPNAFKLADIAAFQTIADQMAISIENVRLFERAQRDLADIETLNRQLTGEAWRSYLTGRGGGAPAGYATSDGRIAPINSTDEAESPSGEGTISLPLKIRGETIGLLDVTSRSGEMPDSDTRSMLEAVAERVALALDSTRLGEQAQRQAEREQILSKISAELQATTDMNAILRIVARESSKALGAPRSFVHLTMEYSKDKPG